jgi:transcription factor CP2 and related proteins
VTKFIKCLFFNRAIKPRLRIYASFDGSSYHALYLHENSVGELTQKLSKLPGFFEYSTNNGNGNTNGNVYPEWGKMLNERYNVPNLTIKFNLGLQSKYSGSGSNIYDASKATLYIDGPAGILVLVSDEVLSNIKDDSLFAIEYQNGKILMKTVYKNEIN